MDFIYRSDGNGPKRMRKLQVKWTKRQTERMIKEVEAREELWHPSAKNYKDRILRSERWDEIAKMLGLPRREVVTKWNGVRAAYRVFFNRKSSESADELQSSSNELYNMLTFLDPAFRLEPLQPRNSTVSNVSENSLHIASPEECSSDQKDVFELSMPADFPNKRLRYDEQEENYDEFNFVNTAAPCVEVPAKSDMWDMVGNFVALNGREWARENNKLANQFRAAIYKVLADFQEKAAETENPTAKMTFTGKLND